MSFKGILNKGRVPVKIWSDLHEVESAALDQLTNISNLPFVFKHVAAMPDVHLGKGATVGSVVATKGAICPAAVGVDIGCGMAAVKTALDPNIVRDNIKRIRQSIERSIPVGHESNRSISDSVNKWNGWQEFEKLSVVGQDKDHKQMIHRAMSQLGSLGGGNHFTEVCLDTENNVWIMLHSGSRNIGKVVAERHIDKAKGLMKQMFINLPDPDLAYFAEKTVEYDNYIDDLEWCQDGVKSMQHKTAGR